MAKQSLDIDVSDYEQLEVFLAQVAQQEGGREQVVAFAARAALRAIPRFGALDFSSDSDDDETILLPSFRATAAPWVAATYPTHSAVLATDAANLTADAALATETASQAADAAVAAAQLADVALAAVHVADATLAARAAVLATRSAADTARAAAIAADVAARAADGAIASAFTADLEAIQSGKRIATQPLWPDGEPEWALANWLALCEFLDTNENWWVWRQWYEARLRGGDVYPKLSASTNERIELARVVEIEEGDWERGPGHVNAKIKAIIERETTNSPPDQVFSSVHAVWKNGRVVNDPTPVGAELEEQSQIAALQAIKDELIEVAAELDGEANIDHRPANHMRRTAELIPASLPSATELNRLIRREATMLGHLDTVQEQWPDFLADSYTTLTEGFTEALDRFAERREVRRSDFSAALDGTDSQAAREDLSALTQAMRSNLGSELIDPAVPTTIENIADEIPEEGPLEDLSSRLATVDSFESANNVLKAIAEGGDAAGKKELAIEFLDGVIRQVGADALHTGAQKGARTFLEKEAELAVQARLAHLHIEASRPWRERLSGWLGTWRKKLDPRVQPEDDA